MKIEITATNSKERFALAMELKSLGVEYKHPDYDRDVFIVDGSEYIVEGLASYCDEQNILYVSDVQSMQEETSNALEILEFELPAEWAVVFTNSDYSGFSEEEIAEIENFCDKIVKQYGNANFMSKDPEEERCFRTSNDAGTLACDVITYQLIPSKEVVNPADQISSITKEMEEADKKAQTQDL